MTSTMRNGSRKARAGSNSPRSAQLLFVTATDLDQFKNRGTMKQVRTHVMHNHLDKQREPSPSRRCSNDRGPRICKPARQGLSVANFNNQALQIEFPSIEPRKDIVSLPSSTLSVTHSRKKSRSLSAVSLNTKRSSPLQSCNASPKMYDASAGDPTSMHPSVSTSPQHHNYFDSGMNSPSSSGTVSSGYEYGLLQPTTISFDPLLTTTTTGVEIYSAFPPQTSYNAEPTVDGVPISSISATYLERLQSYACHVLNARILHLETIPGVLDRRQIYLSILSIAAAHMDAMCEITENIEAEALRLEVMGMIFQQSLQSYQEVDDTNLISSVHLLRSNLIIADNNSITFHHDAIARILEQRGGMYHGHLPLGISDLLRMASLEHALFEETGSTSTFNSIGKPLNQVPLPNGVTNPAVLYAPGHILHPPSPAPRFSQVVKLLSDVHHVTDIYLGSMSAAASAAESGWVSQDMATLQRFHSMLCLLPALDDSLEHHRTTSRSSSTGSPHSSPAIPSMAVAGNTFGRADWIYEACRIAALIYTTAIVRSMRFSVAAIEVSVISAFPTAFPSSTPLLKRLRYALHRAGTEDCWGELWHTLLWVTAIGGAAAHGNSPYDNDRNWIVATAIKCSMTQSVHDPARVMKVLGRVAAVAEKATVAR